ncbi:Gfo/Idh/MocA family protein [Synoicihabitans lomoniglobus]|uniref:Gfo/Idh/MocA family oxidoreductase n=1 Tax=Synoicihabitans lomoniglobus TaxID=2909285 RepID=A0AAE9ZV36_9BACT|nr:Gfo/Idh/MocA family oxidoreductase [Opitutaceae bacterium LMO-M01]WED63614.1 Gfo/Idh/MocA family oxidoreductase [Opitutaceae bacterium LMO-M01]
MSKKIAIIGAGGMAAYHIAGFRQAGAEVIAMADVNHDAAKATAAKQGIPQTFGDVAEMFTALPELDGVSVIVPNKFHAPLALQAMQAGKNVFCEKPPAMSAAEMAELKATAESTGQTLMFNFNNRARPESYAMRGYVTDGSIGTINTCQAKWIRRAGIPGFGGWFTNKGLAGGGPLIDLLHMIDLGMHFMGYPEPAHVLATTYHDHIDNKAFKGPWGIPDNAKGVNDVEAAAHGFVTFKTGQSMSFQVSWAEMNQREECSCVFQGSKAGGMIRRLFGVDGLDETSVDDCELYTVENGLHVNRTIKVAADETMGRERSAANFIKTLEGTEKPLNTPSEALSLMKLIDGAYASAASGTPVAL